jgi:hypothetical protein
VGIREIASTRLSLSLIVLARFRTFFARKTGSAMNVIKVMRISLVVLCILVIDVTTSVADPYYTVTDLGRASDVVLTTDASGQEIVKNSQTGIAYAFRSR